MKYLLDTNVVVRMIEGDASVRRQMQYRSLDDIGMSALVRFELYFGAFKGARVNHNLGVVEGLAFKIIAFDADDARNAAEIRVAMSRAGTPIGPYDVLIAGQARARDLTLVTHNLREFTRVPGLRVENWEA